MHKRDNAGVQQGLSQGGQGGIQQDLKASSDRPTALSVLKMGIAGRLSLALGSSSSGEVDEHTGLISLGLDSLVAVEIRSWLLKMLEVDVPVLKLLSGASLRDICDYVLGQLPDFLRPWEVAPAVDGGKGKEVIHTDPQQVVSGSSKTTDTKNGFNTTTGTTNGTWTPNSNSTDSESNGSSITIEDQAPAINLGVAELQARLGEDKQQELEFERVGDMSRAQAQLYFLQEYLQNNAHNVAYSGHFHGPLDMTRLREALRVVGKRHECAYFMDKDLATRSGVTME